MEITEKWLNENKTYPMLVIGDAVTDFKKCYRGKIESVSNMEEMRELVAYYSNIKYLERDLVVDDISLFAKNGEGLLLKFVEETKLNLVLLSRFDKVSNVLLSRIKRVVKYYKEPVTSQFLSVSSGYKMVEQTVEQGTNYYDKIRYMGKYSPKQIYLEKNIRQRRNKEKILSFVD